MKKILHPNTRTYIVFSVLFFVMVSTDLFFKSLARGNDVGVCNEGVSFGFFLEVPDIAWIIIAWSSLQK